MTATSKRQIVPGMAQADIDRVAVLLRDIGGQHVSWGAQAFLDVWLAEVRMEADRQASRRLTVATWALVAMTLVLALATVGLIVATVTAS